MKINTTKEIIAPMNAKHANDAESWNQGGIASGDIEGGRHERGSDHAINANIQAIAPIDTAPTTIGRTSALRHFNTLETRDPGAVMVIPSLMVFQKLPVDDSVNGCLAGQ